MASVVTFCLVTILAIFPLAKLHGISVEAKGIFMFLGLSILFALAVYGLAFLASVIFKEKKQSNFFDGRCFNNYVRSEYRS
jgi:ABC-type transport system involved in multi-copper enzyme maturation permease subunit